MGFAEKWGMVEAAPSDGKCRNNIPTILTIRPDEHLRGYSENTENIEHRGSTLSPCQADLAFVPPEVSPLGVLARFEINPMGAVHWLAGQKNAQPRHLSKRWVAVIRAEARARLAEVAE